MELECRGYMREPLGEVNASQLPVDYDEKFAAANAVVLERF